MKFPATNLSLILSLYASASLLAAPPATPTMPLPATTPPTTGTPATAIARPTIPGRIFAITDFGAIGDDKTMCNDAIKQAISAATKAGGGVVLVPATEAGGADFLTGPISLTSNIELRIEKGALLQFSSNPDDFPIKTSRHADLITIHNCHDVAVTGEGTIDGAGDPWWKAAAHAAKSDPKRPYFLSVTACQRLLLHNVTLADIPSTGIMAGGSTDVTIDHIKVTAAEDSPTTAGIEFTGQNLSIANSTFDVSDDDIAFKPGGEGNPGHPECTNLQVSNCTILHGKGIVIGGQTTGGLRGLAVSNCTFDGTQYGIRVRADRGRGGLCEEITYDNITMHDVKFPIYFSSYFPTIPKNAATDKPQAVTPTTPIWRNIRISNFTAVGALNAGSICGLPEEPITDVYLSNIKITASRPMEITHAKAIHFTSAKITAGKGKPVLATDAEVTGIDAVTSPTPAPSAPGDALP
jgi:polygalacturonase